MGLTVEKSFFAHRDHALEDIRQNGTWPTTVVSPPSVGRPVHWHSDEVHGYVIEGETHFFDEATGRTIAVSPGDKVTVPARCLHAEGPVERRVVYLIALPAPRAPDEFLLERPPAELSSRGSSR